jgi:hypothetical protein
LGKLPERETEGTESLRKAIGERQALELRVRVFRSGSLAHALRRLRKRDDDCNVCVAERQKTLPRPGLCRIHPPRAPLRKRSLG